MAHLSKDEIARAATEIQDHYKMIYLLADGYYLALQDYRVKRKLVTAVFVDGRIKGSDVARCKETDRALLPEIALKFHCHKKRGLSQKTIKVYEKLDGKAKCKKNGVYDKNIMTEPFFPTPSAALLHINKHCKDVKRLSDDEYASGLAEKTHAAGVENA